jgi:hypothetical protein
MATPVVAQLVMLFEDLAQRDCVDAGVFAAPVGALSQHGALSAARSRSRMWLWHVLGIILVTPCSKVMVHRHVCGRDVYGNHLACSGPVEVETWEAAEEAFPLDAAVGSDQVQCLAVKAPTPGD